MSKNYSTIDDEDELHRLLNNSEDFEERKKIRSRLREVRDKREKEWELKRQQREKESEDLVRKRFQQAEEEKKKKMEAFKVQASQHSLQDSKHLEVKERQLKEKMREADEEKQRRLEAFDRMARKEDIHSTSTVHTETKDGKTVTTRKVESVSRTGGHGGTSYGKPAAKPTSAMNAFKKMDAANPQAGGAKTKPGLARNPSAIKTMLLEWTKAMTREYNPKVDVQNFSTSWNDGLAFCALIHHFYPDSFNFESLDGKNRRSNFELAFDTAEKYADIAPLLDVEDMVKMKKPDWKCVFTYVQSFYRKLQNHERNRAM